MQVADWELYGLVWQVTLEVNVQVVFNFQICLLHPRLFVHSLQPTQVAQRGRLQDALETHARKGLQRGRLKQMVAAR